MEGCEVVCVFFNDLFPLSHYVWTPYSQNMTKTRLVNAWNWKGLCAGVPQSSIQWNVRIAGVRAWWVSGTAASSAMATSFVRAVSGVVMPAALIATSIRWRSTPHGYVPSLSRDSSPRNGNSAIVTHPHVIIFFLPWNTHKKEMLCILTKLFFSL